MKRKDNRTVPWIIALALLGSLLIGAYKAFEPTAPTPTRAPLVVTALLPTPTIAPTMPPTPTQEVIADAKPVATVVEADPVLRVIVTAEPGLNLRDKPGGHVVGSVPRDTELKVKIAGEWALVTEGVHEGKYVAARYLKAAK